MNAQYLNERRSRYTELRNTIDTVLDVAKREGRDLSPAEQRQVETYAEECRSLHADITAMREDQQREMAVGRVAAAAAAGMAGTRAGGAGGWESLTGGQTRGGGDRDVALRSAEAAHRAGYLPQHAADRLSALLDAGSVSVRASAARWAAVAGSEHYRSAFAKLIADPQRGHLLWTGPESESFRAVEQVRAAMAEGTGSTGGFLLPTHLDPALLLTSDGSRNPLRQIARVETISFAQWNGVTSAGVTAEWKAEGAAASEVAPALAPAPVPVHLGEAFTPFSFELEMDALDLAGQLQMVLTDAADQLQADAYTTGSGNGQPTGIATALAAVAGSKVATATADTIVADDFVKLQNALPPRFQAGARWTMNLSTINEVAGFETTNGALRFPEMAQNMLLRKPFHELSLLDSAGDTATAGNDNVAVYGSFDEFLIVDRIGTTIEPIMHLFDPDTGAPTAQRGALMWFRTGSNVLVANAFRMLTA